MANNANSHYSSTNASSGCPTSMLGLKQPQQRLPLDVLAACGQNPSSMLHSIQQTTQPTAASAAAPSATTAATLPQQQALLTHHHQHPPQHVPIPTSISPASSCLSTASSSTEADRNHAVSAGVNSTSNNGNNAGRHSGGGGKQRLFRVGYYELEKTIGKGNFAVVKLASNIVTKSKVAIKIIDKTCLDDDNLAKTYREITLLKRLRHHHITRLYEVMESRQMIYLVMEYAARGEIFDHLVEHVRLKESEAARVFGQIISAVDYCHRSGIVHRDLKAENVLLDQDMNIKLADFGFSNTFEPNVTLRTWCGSPPYAAPEVFLGQAYDGPRADIWSLGIMLYVMTCGALPFDGDTLHDLRTKVLAGKFRIPYFMSQDCEHLIRHMLFVEPEKRLNMQQIQRHRWMACAPSPSPSEAAFEADAAASAAAQQLPQPHQLNAVVVNHMLQLPNLTFDEIAESVHQQTFNHVFAIYHLLVDKLSAQRREEQRLQQHIGASSTARRNNRASITTGIVDRSESIRHDETAVDRLSPLTSSISSNFSTFPGASYPDNDLERFCDMEIDPSTERPQPVQQQRFIEAGSTMAAVMMDDDSVSCASVPSDVSGYATDGVVDQHHSPYQQPHHLQQHQQHQQQQQHHHDLMQQHQHHHYQQQSHSHHQPATHYYHTTVASSAITAAAAAASVNAARRHTVGPGDVTYEQSLCHPPINFKFGDNLTPGIVTADAMHGGGGGAALPPTNLPMLQNQPLQNFGVKNHHLLKPPTVMENSSFGRRASDGGANLQIYYPTTGTVANAPLAVPGAGNAAAAAAVSGASGAVAAAAGLQDPSGVGVAESGGASGEIQRFMHGLSEESTDGCRTPAEHEPLVGSITTGVAGVPGTSGGNLSAGSGSSSAGSGSRTRRSGLLTVMERPPVISPDLVREVEARMNRNYMPPALKHMQHLNHHQPQQQSQQTPHQSSAQQQQQQQQHYQLSTNHNNTFQPAMRNSPPLQPHQHQQLQHTAAQLSTASTAQAQQQHSLMSQTPPTAHNPHSPFGMHQQLIQPQSAAHSTTHHLAHHHHSIGTALPPVAEQVASIVTGFASPLTTTSVPSSSSSAGGVLPSPQASQVTPPPQPHHVGAGQAIVAANAMLAANARRFGGRQKLPTVQEVGRYSPVRRASEGSRLMHHPASGGLLHEYALLQKGCGGAPVTKASLLLSAPPPLDNSISLPGSPIHCGAKPLDAHQKANLHYLSQSQARGGDVECPADIMMKIVVPALDQMLLDNRIGIDEANCIIVTRMVPVDLAQSLGVLVSPGPSMSFNETYQQQQPLHFQALHRPAPAQIPYTPQQQQQSITSQQQQQQHIPSTVAAAAAAAVSLSGTASPNASYYGSGGGSSPMHQITKGLSGLSTGGGSITRGTPCVADIGGDKPLDLSMDVSQSSGNGCAAVALDATSSTAGVLYDLSMTTTHQQCAATPPPAAGSPNLCSIQEEQLQQQQERLFADAPAMHGERSTHQQHPQICLTDVQGGEYTLVSAEKPVTDGTHRSPIVADDSDDSLDGHQSIAMMQSLVISHPDGSLPIAQQPSIVTGVGRKSSLEIDHHHQQLMQQQQQHNFHQQHGAPVPPTYLQLYQPTGHQSHHHMEQRRDSDKSLAFSDDSLSNDSAQLSSPGQDGGNVISTASSSGFKSGCDSAAHSDATCCDAGDASGRLSPDSLSGSTTATLQTPTESVVHVLLPRLAADNDDDDECYELPLPTTCYNLDAHRILAMVKETIDSKMPPMGAVLHPGTGGTIACPAEPQPQSSPAMSPATVAAGVSAGCGECGHASNLSLEYSGGLQIELQVCDGRRPADTAGEGGSPSAPTGNMGLKMRRISGDQFEYGKLCQQLISSLTV